MTYQCPHLHIVGDITQDQLQKKVVCDACKVPGPNLWACIYHDCLYVGCDENRSDHQTLHYKEKKDHCLTMNLSTFRIWCYDCECEVFIPSNSSPVLKRFRPSDVTMADVERDSEDETLDDDRSLKPRGLTGLQNIGNSCYMNAAIQALSNCPPLTQFFLDCGSFIKGDKKPGLSKSYCKLMCDVWHKKRPSYLVPTSISYGMKMVFPVFRGYNQQDSQEFLRCFMDQLHEEMKDPITDDNLSRLPSSRIGSMEFDLSPEQSESTDDSSASEGEYETCESAGSSEPSSISEKTGLIKDTDNVTSTSSIKTLNHRGGGIGGSKYSKSPVIDIPKSLELVSNYEEMATQEMEGSDETSEQSTTMLLSRPSSSLSSIHEKATEIGNGIEIGVGSGGGHLIKGLSASSPTLRTNQNFNSSTSSSSYHLRYQPQTMPTQNTQRSSTNSKGRKKKQVKYRSIISDVFDGKILSSVQCLTCDRVSSTKETFQDLSLPIPNREYLTVLHATQTSVQKVATLSTCTDVYSNQGWFSWMFGWMKSWFWGPTVSLQDCLAAFFSADELKGDNMYSCEKCKKLRNGIKYSKVLSLPEILCIHLKRFRHEVMFSSKINNYVSFPLEGLDMKPFLFKDCSSRVSTYDLVAVICHHGTAVGGHYITYALNCVNDQWYEFDDQCVTEIDPQMVANCEAYVLFYRKTSEDMIKRRQRAVELSAMSRQEPSLMQFYVSKQWVNTFNTFAEPGPINNFDFLCPHGGIHPNKIPIVYELCTVVSQSVWEYLHDTFGGGPPCTNLYSCTVCQNELKALEHRRKQELEDFFELRRDSQSSDSSSACTCAISMSWFRTWESFVKGKENG
ncbi:hypothetical protein CHUAL_009750 [Chamberlinius hualienensis]